MPAVHFDIRWPDGRTQTCYSPSTTITRHLEAGAAYPVDEFLSRCRRGLHAASDRVRQRFGGAGCARAMAQLAAIEAAAGQCWSDTATVRVERFDHPVEA